MPPLCKGRCHSEAVTERLPPLQNNIPSGETTPFAPKRLFKSFLAGYDNYVRRKKLENQ